MTYPNDNFNDRNFTTDNTDLPEGEYRYYRDRIHQDAASGQAQQTAVEGHMPPDANKKSTGRSKKGTALLLAACLVLSLIGGAGGAVIAAKSGLINTGSTVLYQGVEVPSSDGSGSTGVGVSYSGVVQRVEDSVVAITTESVATSYFFRQYVTQGAGSGVVLTTDGYIVTNYHVINGAQQITVTTNDGTAYSATLVGIVNAKSSSDSSGNAVDNIGFAIPINSVKPIIEDLISHGYVTGKIVLGVTLVDITDERTAHYYGLEHTGVYLQSVQSGSIADLGGLRAGDRLVSFGDAQISTGDDLKTALAAHSVGDRVDVKVVRNGKEYTHSLVLTEYVPESAN